MNADNLMKTLVRNTLRTVKAGRVTSPEQKATAARWLARLDQIEAVATAPEPPAPDGTASGLPPAGRA